MEAWFIWAGIALCAFSLWAIARHDWLRLTRPSRRVMARVAGHRVSSDEGLKNYAAIFSFSDEAGAHEVVDAVLCPAPEPEAGTMRELVYPQGRPDLARPKRRLLWATIYVFLAALLVILFSKWAGWIE